MSVRNQQLKSLLIGSFSWLRLLRSSLLIYILVTIAVYFLADGMIFVPQPSSYKDTDDIIKIPVTPDHDISAVLLPSSDESPVILYMHGNAEDLGHVRPILEDLRDWGFTVFSYDYRGYGTSDGKPSVRNAYEDAEAAYRYLTLQRGVHPGDLIVYGRSVGGGSAVYLASKYPVGGLVLESTFVSAFRVVLPVNIFPFDRFPNLKRLANVTAPVLILHGRRDTIIPFHHGQKLFESVSGPRRHLWVDEAGHNDFVLAAGDSYRKVLLDFRELVTEYRVR